MTTIPLSETLVLPSAGQHPSRIGQKTVGPKFPISVKLNSADFRRGGFPFKESLQVVQLLEAAGCDLLKIWGGNYEQADMMNVEGIEEKEEQTVHKALSTASREAYFLDFALVMQKVVKIPLMVTGGFVRNAPWNMRMHPEGWM